MFFNFHQNNSGGYFVEDMTHGVCEEIVIEARDAKEAIYRLHRIGDEVHGFHSYCECCGERWHDWIDDDDGTEGPEIYGTPVEEAKEGPFRKKVFVHYLDGTFKLFGLK